MDYAIILRTCVSEKAAGRNQALLESLGLVPSRIDIFTQSQPSQQSVVEFVHDGLLEWVQSSPPKTWEMLINAMSQAKLAVQDVDELKKLLQKGVCTRTFV